jgi:hypothetical protein
MVVTADYYISISGRLGYTWEHSREIIMKLKTTLTTILFSLSLFAHDGIEHVKGTVTAVTADSITVETAAHKSVTVLLDPASKFTNNGAEASLKQVKTGQAVVIDSKENADKKLVGVTVKMGSVSEHHEH